MRHRAPSGSVAPKEHGGTHTVASAYIGRRQLFLPHRVGVAVGIGLFFVS